MKAIVAVDRNWGIGKGNDLLFNIPEDMKFFRTTTKDKVVVMGSNTLRSFPNGNPLKNRVNIVLSTTLDRDDVIIAKNMQELSKILKGYNPDDLFIIGGAKFYKTMLDYCDTVYVTKVEADGGAEVFFENLDNLEHWVCVKIGEPIETNGFTIRFCEYQNICVKEF